MHKHESEVAEVEKPAAQTEETTGPGPEQPVNETTSEDVAEGPINDLQGESQPSFETIDFNTLSDEDKLQVLTDERLGSFDLPSLSLDDLKYLRSRLQGEQEFTGPQQAFQLMNTFFGVEKAFSAYSNVVKKAQKDNTDVPVISLPAATIEGAIMFTGSIKGKGIEQARQVVKIAVALNTPAKRMRDLDEAIKGLQEKIKLNTPVNVPGTGTPAEPQIQL